MEWKYEKFIGDAAIYATCGKCGFIYCCSTFVNNRSEINRTFLFCPMCGDKATNAECCDVEVVWNEREIP